MDEIKQINAQLQRLEILHNTASDILSKLLKEIKHKENKKHDRN